MEDVILTLTDNVVAFRIAREVLTLKNKVPNPNPNPRALPPPDPPDIRKTCLDLTGGATTQYPRRPSFRRFP